MREALYDCMWNDVGILRTAASLQRAQHTLAGLDAQLARTGVTGAGDRAFHLGWHDWLNLHSLIAVSRVITLSALARTDSRGAHFREDFPDTGDLPGSTFIVVRQHEGRLAMSRVPVRFTRVAPGQTLLPIVERLLQEAENLKQAGKEFVSRLEGGLSIAATHSQARYALPHEWAAGGLN